ncbi:MAG TPA: hypothetical protein VF463_08575 [Sphingobium sp.]
MSDYTHLMWQRAGALLKSFATSSGAKAIKVTIILEVKEGYCLSDILRQCHEAQVEGRLGQEKPVAARARSKPADPAPLGLPAPLIGLPFYGDEG